MSVTKIIFRKVDGTYRKVIVPIHTMEEYLAERSAPQHVSRFHAVRNGNDDEKKHLIQFNYTIYPPEEETPLRGYKIPSDTFCLDIDCASKEESDKYIERIFDVYELSDLMLVERTAHYGLHVVFKREYGKTILESQVYQAWTINCEMDTNAKDLQRVWYASTNEEDELIYINPMLFELGWDMKKAEAEVEILNDRVRSRLDRVPEPARKSDKHFKPRDDDEYNVMIREWFDKMEQEAGGVWEEEQDSKANDMPDKDCSQREKVTTPLPLREGEEGGASYQGIPFSTIIAKYWEMFNDGKEPSEGNRNVLTYELAMTLRPICEYNLERLMKVVPNYWEKASSCNLHSEQSVTKDSSPRGGWEGAEYRRTLESACSQPVKGMSYRLRQVLKAVREEMTLRKLSEGNSEGNVEDSIPHRPERMPDFLTLVSSKVPMKYKAMVEESIWPALCVHLRGVKFKYIDGVEHEANICSPLIARQSSGKGLINQPIEAILADITAKDKESDAREGEWRKRNQGKATSKDRQPRPDDICIQRLDDDLTSACLAQTLIDAERNGGKRVITKVDEIEMLNKVGNGKNETVGLLVRYGFDSQRFGQRRVGLESVNGSYTVRWVWNASCTLKSARKFITQDWIGNGSLSRLNLNALLLAKDDHEMPRIGDYDDEYNDRIKTYIDRLNAASGLIECPQADKVAEEMVAEHDQIADLSDDEGYRTLSYRAVVIGWLKANLLFILNGYKWDKVFGEYVKYSVRRDMWLKMYFFGKEINAEFEEEEQRVTRGPQNMLALLPNEFTREDYFEMRRRIGKPAKDDDLLKKWKKRGLIVFDDVSQSFVQCKKE